MDDTAETPADAFSLSLRAWPAQDPNAESLPSLIPRINEQRGHFRNITEDGLEEEIRAAADGHARPEGADEGDENVVQDAKGRQDEVLAAREEIVKFVSKAQMEALYALDFVSLLLSKDTPKQAEVSMSSYLQQHVPSASLGAGKVQPPQVSEAERRDEQLVSRGWKMQSLNSAADSLLRSAHRLEQEIEHETQYWEQVLSVSEKGWAVCRLPRERHTLGVRFGFAEAAPEFKDRGLAALRRGEDGSLVLDQGPVSTEPKTVRVRIQGSEGRLIGASTLRSSPEATQLPIEELILRARNTIYEEECFHELIREARTLVSQGVKTFGSVIHLPQQANSGKQILIDLVSPDNIVDVPSPDTQSSANDLAESIALSLRILLSYAHRQNFYRRAQPPPPLTARKRPTPIHSILRPILTHLQHRDAIRDLSTFLCSFSASLQTAGFPSPHTLEIASNFHMPLSPSTTTTPFTILTQFTKSNTKPPSESLIEALLAPIDSTATMTLPSSATLSISVRTHLYPPLLGTEYRLSAAATTTPSSARTTAPFLSTLPIRFTSRHELTSYLHHLCTLDLVSVACSPDEPSGWSPSPLPGELTKTVGGRKKTLVIEVPGPRGQMEVRRAWADGTGRSTSLGGGASSSEEEEAEKVHVWDGVRGRDEEGRDRTKSFREVVAEAGREE